MYQAMRRQQHRRGFTLIELLIVIVVIAILALIVIPRLLSASRKAKEARLHDNLCSLRAAIELFQSDTGEFPRELVDVVAPTADALSSDLTDIVKSLYRGPYLNTSGRIQVPGYPGIPANPFLEFTDIDVSAHWTYDHAAGTVISSVTGTTLNGIPYSEL